MPRRPKHRGRPQHRAAHPAVRGSRRSATTGSTGTRSPRCSRPGDAAEDKAELFPTDAERTATTAWIRGSLRSYEAEHAGEPGHVTVRRLTSAEYCLRDSRSDRHRRQGRHRCVERLGWRRRVRQLRRRPVRAGHQHRALSRSREAGGRSRRHRRGTARVLSRHRARRDSSSPRSTGSTSSTPQRDSASCRAKADGRSASSGTARRSTSPGTTSTARRSAIPAATHSRARREGRHHRPLRRAHLDGREQAEHRLSDARARLTAGRSCRRRRPTSRPRLTKARAGVRRALEDAHDLAQLVFRARRSGRRRRGRREPARVRRQDAEGRTDAPLHLRARGSRRARPRRSARRRDR